MSITELTLDQLGAVARGRSRHRPRDAAFLYGGPYPFVQTGDVKKAGLYLREYEQTYSEAGLSQSKLWPVGTLCITIAANIAETSILAIEACFPDSVIGFIAAPDKSDARFVKYLFDAALKMRLRSFTQGAAQDNLSQEKLLSIRFPVPEVGVQKKIANILSAYDDLIENNRRRILLLEEAARLLYREWFVYCRFPGHEHVKMLDGLPEGWDRRKLGDLAIDVSYGFTESANHDAEGPKFLRITDIVDGPIDWSSVPRCPIPGEKLQRFLLDAGDIVVARTGATTGWARRIGRQNEPSVFASYLVRFRFDERYRPELAAIFMESDAYKAFVKANLGGAAQPNASAKVLGSAPVPVPTRKLQNDFAESVAPTFEQIDVLMEQNQKLAQARDLLLPRLMSGEIAA